MGRQDKRQQGKHAFLSHHPPHRAAAAPLGGERRVSPRWHPPCPLLDEHISRHPRGHGDPYHHRGWAG